MISQNGHFDFEEPIVKLLARIEELSASPDTAQIQEEIARLRTKLDKTKKEIYGKLNRWQKTMVARHPKRPYTLDFVRLLYTDFVELHGDRCFADDPAIVCGMARYKNRPVAVVGHQKGRETRQKLMRNFGMPKPEGYRKALRIMKLAEKFNRPVFSFIDTPGAYPGMDAEERGQAEAIARNLREMAGLRIPIIVTVVGEGGSGGALAIGVGDVVNMLEFATYSVISPEACSSILWKNTEKAAEAAERLKLTAPDLKAYGIVDAIIEEPPGGAHTDHIRMAELLDPYLQRELDRLSKIPPEERIALRYEKFRKMGAFQENR
jgi:acetyl-CoA carboxylase carboxyl transferase subunit alpha